MLPPDFSSVQDRNRKMSKSELNSVRGLSLNFKKNENIHLLQQKIIDKGLQVKTVKRKEVRHARAASTLENYNQSISTNMGLSLQSHNSLSTEPWVNTMRNQPVKIGKSIIKQRLRNDKVILSQFKTIQNQTLANVNSNYGINYDQATSPFRSNQHTTPNYNEES